MLLKILLVLTKTSNDPLTEHQSALKKLLILIMSEYLKQECREDDQIMSSHIGNNSSLLTFQHWRMVNSKTRFGELEHVNKFWIFIYIIQKLTKKRCKKIQTIFCCDGGGSWVVFNSKLRNEVIPDKSLTTPVEWNFNETIKGQECHWFWICYRRFTFKIMGWGTNSSGFANQ